MIKNERRYCCESSLAAMLILGLLTVSCSSFKVAHPTRTDDFGSPEYVDIANHNYYHESPEVPLRQIDHYKLTAAPIKDVFVIGNAVVMVTKNGRAYGEIISGKKIRGKLKFDNNSEAFATLYKDRYLLLALKLARNSLLCYDLIEGKYKWKTNAGLQGAAPVAADSTVYVISRFKHASRYSLATGKRIWKKKTDEFAHTTACIANDLLVFGTDAGTVKTLYRKDGEPAWERQLKGPFYATPIFDGKTVFVFSVDESITALHPETGDVIWEKMIKGGVWETPALKGDQLIVATSSGKIYSLNTADGAIQWENTISTPVGTSPVIASDQIFIGGDDRMFYAMDLNSGDITWQTELKGRVRTNPRIAGNYVIVGSENKDVYVFEHEPETESERSQ